MDNIVEVTEKDIAFGKKLSFSRCPVALALRRKLSVRARDVYVTAGGAIVDRYDGIHDLNIPFPPVAQKFVSDFESGKKVRPFFFRIMGRKSRKASSR